MKVLIINGSPHFDGCTAAALKEVATVLEKEGIETETVTLGHKGINGCIGCCKCFDDEKCIYDDLVNELAPKIEEADGLLIGTPVYFAGVNGNLKSLLDRLFYSTKFDKKMKVGAAVVSSRRAGSTSAIDEINKYFMISNMPVVSSSYWNEVHGSKGTELDLDEAVTTAFVLAMDTKNLCSDDCKGLCAKCGADLNLGPCGCRPEVDPRLAALAQLLDNEAE